MLYSEVNAQIKEETEMKDQKWENQSLIMKTLETITYPPNPTTQQTRV